jgi:signal peptidase I
MMTEPTGEPLDLEYQGETRARNPQIATLLTILCPGLGYMYAGHLLGALTTNLLFVLFIQLGIIAFGWLKFFPLLPALVLVLGWALLTAVVALNVRALIRDEMDAHDYVLKTYNHWVFYTLVAVFTMAVPTIVSARQLDNMWLTAPVLHDGMAPTMLRGDLVLVDRQGWRAQDPGMGELVAVTPSADAPTALLRVVAVPGEIVRMEHEQLYISDETTDQRPVEPGELGQLTLPPIMVPMVEQRGQRLYPVLLSRRGGAVTSVEQRAVREEHVFLLTDNRGQVPLAEGGARMWDSRDVGTVPLSRIEGKPLYILWSSDPATGAIRWDRIGLRLAVQDSLASQTAQGLAARTNQERR